MTIFLHFIAYIFRSLGKVFISLISLFSLSHLSTWSLGGPCPVPVLLFVSFYRETWHFKDTRLVGLLHEEYILVYKNKVYTEQGRRQGS